MKNKADTIDLLQRYLDGTLSVSERERIERLLERDEQARDMLALLKALRAESERSRGLLSASRQMAANMVKQFAAGSSRKKAPVAVTIFDSRLLPIPEGVRPATVDTSHLSYRLGDIEVDVSLYPVSPERFEVIGQVFGLTSDHPLSIRLRSGRSQEAAETDQFGVFRFASLTRGHHRLELRSGSSTVGQIKLEL